MKDGEFFLGEHAVGRFVESEVPLTRGRHGYEPYRGTGHLEVSRALERGERPRCWRSEGEARVWFSVTSEELFARSPKSEWWITIDEVETVEREEGRITSEQLAALIVDALADARLIARAQIPSAIEVAAEEIEVRKAMGDY